MTRPFVAAWWQRNNRLLILGAVTVVAYVGAINRGEAILWGVAATMAATLLIAVFWPQWVVQRLKASRSGPARAVEDERVTFQVTLTNGGLLPRHMVEILDHLPFAGVAAGTPAVGPIPLGYFAQLPPLATRRIDVLVHCEKRGRYQLGPLVCASGFPLGLRQARRSTQSGSHSLIVYPSTFTITSLPLTAARSQLNRGQMLLPDAAGDIEFRGLREYQPGDHPRHIHWPTSARKGQIMVKELEPVASASLIVALDLARGSDIGKGRHTTLEYGIKIAASIAGYACSQGFPIRVVGAARERVRTVAGTGAVHHERLLEVFATAQADGAVPYHQLLANSAFECAQGETVVVFLSPSMAEESALLDALALLQAHGASLLAVVFDRTSFDGGVPPGRPAFAASLVDLGAHVIAVRQGDNLAELFLS